MLAVPLLLRRNNILLPKYTVVSSVSLQPLGPGHPQVIYHRSIRDPPLNFMLPLGYHNPQPSESVQYPSTISSGHIPYPASSLTSLFTSNAVTKATGFQTMSTVTLFRHLHWHQSVPRLCHGDAMSHDYIDRAHQAYSATRHV